MRKILGFTVIELVLCIVLLSILAAISIPRLFSKKSFDEQFVADEIVASIRYAQKMAIASGCRMQISVLNNTLTLQRAHDCASGTFDITVTDPFTGIPYIKPIPAGISKDVSALPIYFDSVGRAYSSATNTVDDQYVVTVQDMIITIVGETGYTYAM